MELFILMVLIAFVSELIDSSLGMMYGTILSPLLIIFGFAPELVVPSILFSQAMGGFMATFFHHKNHNAVFHPKSKDFKIAFLIFSFGIIAVVIGALVGSIVSGKFMNTYIGILCMIMGTIVLYGRSFLFSWTKVLSIGIVSSFNKALSGGGFGPIVASGLIISGQGEKQSIGTTDFAEAPICFTAFLSWIIFNGYIPLTLLAPLTVGAIFGGLCGPFALAKIKSQRTIKIIVGILVVFLGLWTLLKTWVI